MCAGVVAAVISSSFAWICLTLLATRAEIHNYAREPSADVLSEHAIVVTITPPQQLFASAPLAVSQRVHSVVDAQQDVIAIARISHTQNQGFAVVYQIQKSVFLILVERRPE